jgi:hypothetical protein
MIGDGSAGSAIAVQISQDFTPIRVRILRCRTTLVTGHSGANDGQKRLRVPVTE